MTATLSFKLNRINACTSALQWAHETPFDSIADAWAACPNPSWLLWFAWTMRVERKRVVAALCACARLVGHRYEFDVFEQWTRGEAPIEEVFAIESQTSNWVVRDICAAISRCALNSDQATRFIERAINSIVYASFIQNSAVRRLRLGLDPHGDYCHDIQPSVFADEVRRVIPLGAHSWVRVHALETGGAT